jgi:hypothetical protein
MPRNCLGTSITQSTTQATSTPWMRLVQNTVAGDEAETNSSPPARMRSSDAAGPWATASATFGLSDT